MSTPDTPAKLGSFKTVDPTANVYPWQSYLDTLARDKRDHEDGPDPDGWTDEIDEFSGDPFDIDTGDIVFNEALEVRIVLDVYSSDLAGRPQQINWFDLATGRVHSASMSGDWATWAGQQLWFLHRVGVLWGLRSPFDDGITYRASHLGVDVATDAPADSPAHALAADINRPSCGASPCANPPKFDEPNHGGPYGVAARAAEATVGLSAPKATGFITGVPRNQVLDFRLHLTGRRHELKTLPSYYDAVAEGQKPFELRRNDRDGGFQVGDILILREWNATAVLEDDGTYTGAYTGRALERIVTYVLHGGSTFEMVPIERFADGSLAPRTCPLALGWVILGLALAPDGPSYVE